VNVGDKVRVVVLKYDPERERVSLGMKQILPDPWSTVGERFTSGMKVQGKVVSLTDYGAFVELEKGVEGLIPRLRDVVDAAREPSVEGAATAERGRRGRSSTSIRESPHLARLEADEPNPWEMVKINHPVGSHIQGKVKSITDFGVFVGVGRGHRRPRARLRPALDQEAQAPLRPLQEGRRRRGGRARDRRRERAHLARHQAAPGRPLERDAVALPGRLAA
jgi:predicted RNA-binding protein with RPS1 domain